MSSTDWVKLSVEGASANRSYRLLDGVVSTQVNLQKLCRGLKAVMVHEVEGLVFDNRDEEDFERFKCSLGQIGDEMRGKLKKNSLTNPYYMRLEPIDQKDPLVTGELENCYKQFMLTGVAEEATVWAQFTDRKEFMCAEGCKAVPSSAFGAMCLCLAMRHKIWPWSIYQLMCAKWPVEGKRCKGDMKKLLSAGFVHGVVREMVHGEVEIIKIWGDEVDENVEKIARKGDELRAMMTEKGVDVVDMN